MISFYINKANMHVSGCCKPVLSSNQPSSPLLAEYDLFSNVIFLEGKIYIPSTTILYTLRL